MKKLLALLLCAIMILGCSVNVFAGEYDENEQYIINQISSEKFPVKIEQQYINQLKNYFYRDEIKLEKIDAEDFVAYLKNALVEKAQLEKKKSSFDEKSSVYQNLEKAATIIGLQLEYDSKVNDFYVIDEEGYIVIDNQEIIKDTDKDNSEEQDWNISIEVIFAIAVVICILGIVANLRRMNKRMKRHSSKNYDDDDEDDDELESATRKTRRARLQTLSYKSTKQILKYFYIPIIMGLIVVGVGFVVFDMYSDLSESIQNSFINTQPLYNEDNEGFIPTTVEQSKQAKTIELSEVVWPKYGEQYGLLQCEALKINAPVYLGDRGELLAEGAGSYLGSSVPGQGGTILIGAHDTTYFAGLENVKEGDNFIFTTEYGIYEYKVTGFKVYDEGGYDKAYDLSSEKEQLVLYTCYPFGTLNGTKTERMFVYLDKISGPDILY